MKFRTLFIYFLKHIVLFIPILYSYCRINRHPVLPKGASLPLVVPGEKKLILYLLCMHFCVCVFMCICMHVLVQNKINTVYLFSWMPLFGRSPFFSKLSHTFLNISFSFSLHTCQILPLPTEKFLACLSLCLYSCQHNCSSLLISFLRKIIPDWI